MKEKNNRYVIRGNKWVVKTVPSTKQIEEKPTNISIECKICSRMADKFVRIVMIDSDGSKAYLNGICCDRCVFTWKAVSGMYIIDKDNKVITPQTITLGQVIPTNDRGWLDDSTKGEQFIKDRERYRNSVRNMIEINKALGTYMPTYKQEMEQKIQQGTYLIDELDDDLKREIYKKIRSGEIKI
jgi:hypothetical protein